MQDGVTLDQPCPQEGIEPAPRRRSSQQLLVAPPKDKDTENPYLSLEDSGPVNTEALEEVKSIAQKKRESLKEVCAGSQHCCIALIPRGLQREMTLVESGAGAPLCVSVFGVLASQCLTRAARSGLPCPRKREVLPP